MDEKKKVVWIIDGAYMRKASPDAFDWLKLKHVLEGPGGASFYEVYYLDTIASPPTEGQEKFITWLKCAPPDGPKFRVQLYSLKNLHVTCPKCGHPFDRTVQKGVDVGIATLIIKLATQNKYERLLLSAGDGDFEDAISYVKSELHKEIYLAVFRGSVSADLQSYADKVCWLDEYRELFKKPAATERIG